jgi:hypothetical protein
MRFLLDTDTCVYVISRRPQHVFDRFRRERIGAIGLSSISLAELRYGTSEERPTWRLIGGGVGIHWPSLDEDVSVEDLILGRSSGESQSSFEAMAGAARLRIGVHQCRLGRVLQSLPPWPRSSAHRRKIHSASSTEVSHRQQQDSEPSAIRSSGR